ncbi:hypothetical protein VP1G_04540 [Cytospora mali]|uniref:Zinc finger C2H2 LYAR-type domain-containing protein n=1 Tax=Cytospora mali TaxID=578113 RepID=A0A194V026_CYTMA|nr:hypothetical protein VP1G_04540 [Valsa mali var. pyri (nom. inval.)]
MVSFQCESCGDVLTKKKLDPHRNRCRGATFTCIDCMVHFYGTDYRSHTSCMTEDQKYQGALYKNKKAKTTANSTPSAQKDMAHAAYVEDVVDHEGWGGASAAPPHAPSPPPANGGVNVFDYQVNATPSASTIALPQVVAPPEPTVESTELVRYEPKRATDEDIDADMMADDEGLVQYGSGPVPVGSNVFETPAPKKDRKKADKEVKKDKKRKRLHVDTNDLDMPDADADAPVAHSGLTGGLNRMMASRPNAFPPSPDYSGSGGEVVEHPATPLKKSKHSKHHHKSSRPESGIFNGITSLLTNGNAKSTTKSKKRKHASTSPTTKKRHSHHGKHLEGSTEVKMLEYTGESKENREDKAESGAVVVFKPRADLFLSLINKGPESDRGYSVHRALKRFHRERSDTGHALGKSQEEKELFRSLRVRRNDRGEIVLFCISESD